jgi:hypothetical protein
MCGMTVVRVVTQWLCWSHSTRLGYLMSVVMAPQNSMVAAVTVCMIVGGFLNGVEPRYRSLSPVMKHVFGESDSMPVLSSTQCAVLSGAMAVTHCCVASDGCAVLCCAVLCCAVLCCAVLCCAVLCCAVLCCAVLCCAVLC